MDSVATQPLPTDGRPVQQHQYGTRIRQNSVIKPSARLRQSPDPPQLPRKIKPIPQSKPLEAIIPSNFPQFPPPQVVLHPDDANSKVLLAIGRSFLSVDNRAMTIKDLAEMTLSFGLVCQNVSAAGQAITTYIRTHMQRCDVQQDHPLLLRHVLSGTPSDDELLPALHSRSGGAHCTANTENRTTNFRRGTMVWYLSRATGAPCPFTRAGIRLCDYGENGKVGLGSAAKDRKRERDRQRRAEQCGQKRKRPLRGCIDKGAESDSPNEDEKRPPKVKLTLRLKPCIMSSSNNAVSSSGSASKRVIDLSKDSDSDDFRDDSMSVDSSDEEDDASPADEDKDVPWSLPPYPRRSISIPCYTPSFDGAYPQFPAAGPSHVASYSNENLRRSPSAPYSSASPPPDSEDEDDDYHITMTGVRRCSADRLPGTDTDWDFEFDSEGEGEALWDSPGPRSPSAPASNMAEVFVKQEPRDVQGMLDEWDSFDSSIADARVIEVVTQAAAASQEEVKIEALDSWNWDNIYRSGSPDWYSPALRDDGDRHIKQEETNFDSLLIPPALYQSAPDLTDDLFASQSPVSSVSSGASSSSPLSSRSIELPRPRALTWKDVELLGPDTIRPHEFDEDEWHSGESASEAIRARAKTVSFLPAFMANPSSALTQLRPSDRPEASVATITPRRDLELPSASASLPAPSTSPSLASLIQSMSMTSMSTPAAIQNSWRTSAPARPVDCLPLNEIVVVHTCQPCTPTISATQIEGISVYQMTLGSSLLFRRIDTDFVNLSTIINHLSLPAPSMNTLPNVTMIDEGSAVVSGIWVPLATAQEFTRDHPLPSGLLNIFLSDMLYARFPSALQDFHRSNAKGRMLNQFGPHFRSTLEARRHSQSSSEKTEWGIDSVAKWGYEPQSLLHSHPPTYHQTSTTAEEVKAVDDTPLSPTEQEMFHAFCSIPDWDKENPAEPAVLPAEPLLAADVDEPPIDVATDDAAAPDRFDRPLRRSKRVADAMAARSATRARSRRRGPKNSLS